MVGVLTLLVAGCGGVRVYSFQGTPRVPQLNGTVQVERVEGESRLLTVKVRQLPAPDQFYQVAPGAAKPRYIAWFVSSPEEYTKVGALAYHPPSRTGNIMATTRQTAFRLLVTSESNPNTLSPGPYVVIDQRLTIR